MAEWFVPLKNIAQWIWLPRDYSPSAPPQTRNETVLFHGALTPPAGTHSIELRVSAEGRYTLWVNDSADPLGHGPARTDRHHRSLDAYSLDISAAKNKTVHLWAQVRWFTGPPDAPLAELHGPVPSFVVIALFLDASGRILGKTGTGGLQPENMPAGASVDGATWLARPCTGIYGTPILGINAYLAVGHLEHQRSSGWPADWRQNAAPTQPGWIPAVAIPLSRLYFKRDPDLPAGATSQPWLIQREIPHAEYLALPIAQIRRIKPPPSERARVRAPRPRDDTSQDSIRRALKPAEVVEISLNFHLNRATVVVNEDQLRLAIGNRGETVRAAAMSTGWDIDICVPQEYSRGLEDLEKSCEGIAGVTEQMLDAMVARGIVNLRDIAEVGADFLTKELAIPLDLANQIESVAGEHAKRIEAEHEARRAAVAGAAPPSAPAFEPLQSLNNLQLAANETVTLRCDIGHYANAYYRIRLVGAGTTIAVTSSEVLSGGDETPSTDAKFMSKTKKSFSLDSPLDLLPFTDTYTLDTAAPYTFEASHWRAFRFLEITLTAGPSGGTLESFTLHATGYPFTPDYSFAAAGETRESGGGTGGASAGMMKQPPIDEIIRQSVDVSWRTLKCCTWETYMDCPYYEQLQYVGDTRIQCLITYFTTGDPTLPVQALRAFDRSRIYEGITQSRYPSHGMQLITTFCLIYIMMLEDYMIYAADDAIVAELRPGIAPILNWFTQFSDHDTGLIGYTPYWPFLDWVNGWDTGIPPHGGRAPGFSEKGFSGANAGINLFHLLALQSAANIYEHTKPGSGNLYASRASQLKQRIYDTFFDAGRCLMCDIPIEIGRGKLGVWSQHAQALAVLADVLPPGEARAAMTTALEPKNVLLATESATNVDAMKAGQYGPRYIAPASLYFLFYVAEALAKLRMGEHLWPILEPFRAALARGSTTWPEALEPARSECHAWSAWPLYFFARHILGIAPPSLEDQKIRVRPLHCPPLSAAAGHFQTHRGPVNVSVNWKDGQRQVTAKGLGVEVVGE